MTSTDNPGVRVPPPLLYAAIFFAAVYIQKRIPLNASFFETGPAKIAGSILLFIALILTVISLRKFFLSKNTIVTIKPATSLQTTGIYKFTRNPMYLSLLFLYLGLTCFLGNWWNLLLLPILVLVIQQYVIIREEKYLLRRFGTEYLDYKNKVRRWL
ncbi:MAG TPA: isoprenylcysteine carboxylmethyltransferase family protein [Hanamia sp.]|nr:isoprenylcysteine carboxylmethyltransferase family protein [Hanamia sp.]